VNIYLVPQVGKLETGIFEEGGERKKIVASRKTKSREKDELCGQGTNYKVISEKKKEKKREISLNAQTTEGGTAV